ncbi:MAG: 2-hydroxyacyl-CoA dehydratase family protein, partial [Thermoanaerobaculia bacterium]
MIEIFNNLRDLLKNYYLNLKETKKPIAYLSAMAPQEIFRAFGFEVFLPENHSAHIGVKRKGEFFIKRAIQEGFSPDICSYLLSDIGSHLEGKISFEEYGLENFPLASLFCFSTNQCYEIGEWFKFLSSLYNVPFFSIPVVKNYNGEKDFLNFFERKILNLIKNIEEFRNEKLDFEKLNKNLKNTKEASIYWEKFLNLNKGKSFKSSFLDHLFLMAPMVLMRGEEKIVNFYKKLYEFSKDQKDRDYKYRFWWEGMPVWGKLRYFKEKFEKLEMAVVGSTYASSWVFNFESKNPVKAISEIYYKNLFITWSEEKKLKWLI